MKSISVYAFYYYNLLFYIAFRIVTSFLSICFLKGGTWLLLSNVTHGHDAVAPNAPIVSNNAFYDIATGLLSKLFVLLLSWF